MPPSIHFPRTRITAQAIAYDVGDAGKYDPILDYALAEYTFNDYIGIRAGRIQRPQGIYNDIQDLDLGRTFVLLPQSVYNARWRDFYESLDGGELFGTVPLGAAGSLTYEVYGGVVQPSADGGLAAEIQTSLPANGRLDKFNWPSITGGQLWWNAPLDGLRLGAAFSYLHAFVDNHLVPDAAWPASLCLNQQRSRSTILGGVSLEGMDVSSGRLLYRRYFQ
jgi:hypothetical protein